MKCHFYNTICIGMRILMKFMYELINHFCFMEHHTLAPHACKTCWSSNPCHESWRKQPIICLGGIIRTSVLIIIIRIATERARNTAITKEILTVLCPHKHGRKFIDEVMNKGGN